MTRSGRFLAALLVAAAATVGMAPLLSVAVDPYGVWGTAKLLWSNPATFPWLEDGARVHARSPDLVAAERLFLGASNMQWGLPVTVTREAPTRAYKASNPFQSLDDHSFYLDKALAAGNPRDVVVSIDPTHFADLGLRPAWRRIVLPSDSLPRILYDLTKLSVPPAALVDALRVAGWRLSHDYGRLNPGAAPSIFTRAYDTGWPLFARASGTIATNFAHEYCQGRRFGFDRDGQSMYDQLIVLARRAQVAGVRLSVVQLPQHLMMMDIYDRVGVGRHYEEWLRRVVSSLAALNAGPLLRFVDFNVPQMRLDEGIPSPDATDADAVRETPIVWWYDALHFSPMLGERILADLERPDGPALGTVVTPDNVEEHLAMFEAFRASAERVLDTRPGSPMRQLRDRLRVPGSAPACPPQSGT